MLEPCPRLRQSCGCSAGPGATTRSWPIGRAPGDAARPRLRRLGRSHRRDRPRRRSLAAARLGVAAGRRAPRDLTAPPEGCSSPPSTPWSAGPRMRQRQRLAPAVATLRREAIRDLGREPRSCCSQSRSSSGAHPGWASTPSGRRGAGAWRPRRPSARWGSWAATCSPARSSGDRARPGRPSAGPCASRSCRGRPAPDQPPTSEDECRLIIAWDGERGLRTFAGRVTLPRRRAGSRGQPSRPAATPLMVQPLCFKNEALGWCLFEMESPARGGVRGDPGAGQRRAQGDRLAGAPGRRGDKTGAGRAGAIAARDRAGGRHPDGHPAQGPAALAARDPAAMVPATEAGGDYFDILPFRREAAGSAIGDVAGHGLHAGLVMMMIQSIVSAATRNDPHASPAHGLGSAQRRPVRQRARRAWDVKSTRR